MFSAFRHAKHSVPEGRPAVWTFARRFRQSDGRGRPSHIVARASPPAAASRRDALIIGRPFSAGNWRFQIGPVPEGRGEPSGLKMIPMTSFAKKSDQASRFFVLNRSSRRFSRPFRTGDPFFFLSTGAEAPAYSRSASPRRAVGSTHRYPTRVPCTSRVRGKIKSANHLSASAG